MTENTKTAMIAINKWFYYAMNYPVVPVEVADFGGTKKEYLPDFFNAFPLYLRGHLMNKWNNYYEEYGSRAALMVFYGELDGENKKILMGWVLDHYNGEQKLSFKEED